MLNKNALPFLRNLPYWKAREATHPPSCGKC